jgi:hypothetical protein
MKIYLSEKKLTNDDFIHVSSIMHLDNAVLDGEATEIVADGFLNQFKIEDLEKVIQKIVSKMRIKSEISIQGKDLDILILKYNRGEISIQDLNRDLIGESPVSSLINVETLQEALPKNIEVSYMSVDQQTGNFLIKGKRSK